MPKAGQVRNFPQFLDYPDLLVAPDHSVPCFVPDLTSAGREDATMVATARKERTDGGAITAALAQQASALDFDALPDEIVAVAKQCLVDWFAVTLAGVCEPLVGILGDELAADTGPAGLLGQARRAGMLDAAVINGAAGHALDFDDVNLAMNGHPTAAVAPAVLALAEVTGASGRDVITGFVAGYETACRIGRLVGTSHYRAGFHATATLGSFGAAAAAARLMGLDAGQTATALGIAGTQAAGLKAMFGTMCKPLHAGKAAANGLLAARLAARGFTSRPDVLEAEQGFVATQADEFRLDKALETPTGGFHLRSNLFKYHAACYLTHSSIEALKQLRERNDLTPDDVEAVTLQVDREHLKVCAIEEPATGLETKFSLRQTAAFAVANEDTAALETYSDTNANRPDLITLRRKVTVDPQPEPGTAATVIVNLTDGRRLDHHVDVGVPAADVAVQGAQIDAKCRSLATPVIGAARTAALLAAIANLDQAANLNGLLDIATGD
jgi:2-methylcitrate dehydratase PrpD